MSNSGQAFPMIIVTDIPINMGISISIFRNVPRGSHLLITVPAIFALIFGSAFSSILIAPSLFRSFSSAFSCLSDTFIQAVYQGSDEHAQIHLIAHSTSSGQWVSPFDSPSVALRVNFAYAKSHHRRAEKSSR